jgi:hypothetical protein
MLKLQRGSRAGKIKKGGEEGRKGKEEKEKMNSALKEEGETL